MHTGRRFLHDGHTLNWSQRVWLDRSNTAPSRRKPNPLYPKGLYQVAYVEVCLKE